MKQVTLYIFLLFSIIVGTSSSGCRAQRITPETYTGKQLIFGNGGGFTGAESAYVLLDNGQLFITTHANNKLTTTYTRLKKLSDKITRQLFSKAAELQIEQSAFSHPGNMYYFIGLKSKQITHRITWGDHQHKAPDGVDNLYHQLAALLPQ